jgi:gliding motility-associated lipoprotein GldH
MTRFIYILFIGITSLFLSCNEQRVYENNVDIEEGSWNKKDTIKFEFEIPDPNLSYNLYYTVRYSNEYPFHNLFARYILIDTAGQVLRSPELPEDMLLFEVKTGKPYGSGIGDIYDQKISFLPNFKFPYKGKYSLKVMQYMREEPLPGIESFGIRVEKAETSK